MINQSVVITLTAALFANTFLQCFTLRLRRLGKLLTLLIFHQNPGTCDKFLKTVDRAINTFVIFDFYSDHVRIESIKF